MGAKVPLEVGNLGVSLTRHDAVSHGSSVTDATDLGELVNCCFHYLLNGEYIGLNTPQEDEEEKYRRFCGPLNVHLKQVLGESVDMLKKIHEGLDAAHSLYLKPLLARKGQNLKYNLPASECKEIYVVPAPYVTTLLKAYDSFFEEFQGARLSISDLFRLGDG
ncbi:MAG: hypothetical protein QNJ31_05920 [Candidatus Caenarcaniphilales bacterium]|nr:hypothetical protein [Candidatus Caenarcaniphilales bacterium]